MSVETFFQKTSISSSGGGGGVGLTLSQQLLLQVTPHGAVLWNPKGYDQVLGMFYLDFCDGHVCFLHHRTNHG